MVSTHPRHHQRHQLNRWQPLRSPSPKQPSPREPQRIRPPPFLHQHTWNVCKSGLGQKNKPMNESALGVHQVKLVIKTSPGLSNGSGVGQHTNCTRNFGKISVWNHSWRLVVDSDLKRENETTRIDNCLESGWAPINKLNRAVGLDCGNCSVNLEWNVCRRSLKHDLHPLEQHRHGITNRLPYICPKDPSISSLFLKKRGGGDTFRPCQNGDAHKYMFLLELGVSGFWLS